MTVGSVVGAKQVSQPSGTGSQGRRSVAHTAARAQWARGLAEGGAGSRAACASACMHAVVAAGVRACMSGGGSGGEWIMRVVGGLAAPPVMMRPGINFGLTIA